MTRLGLAQLRPSKWTGLTNESEQAVGPQDASGEGVDTAVPTRPQKVEFSLSHSRDVVVRAKALAARLWPSANAQFLESLVADLETLDRRLTEPAQKGNVIKEDRRELYLRARWLKRGIALGGCIHE